MLSEIDLENEFKKLDKKRDVAIVVMQFAILLVLAISQHMTFLNTL